MTEKNTVKTLTRKTIQGAGICSLDEIEKLALTSETHGKTQLDTCKTHDETHCGPSVTSDGIWRLSDKCNTDIFKIMQSYKKLEKLNVDG